MKASKAFAVAALLLALFFLSQFVAEMFFVVSPPPRPGRTAVRAEAVQISLSLSSRLHTEAAFFWLEAAMRDKDEKSVKNSMRLLRQALRRNPLDYQARYYLAKSYLQFSAVDNDYFDLGVRELKRAARLRGSNKQIALDCAKVFLSLWPLLGEDDRLFAAGLVANAMPALTWPEFSPLVEMWSLYVQEAPLLMDWLGRKPEFFGLAADQLVAAAIPIAERRELLALHEVHTLDALERRYNEIGLQGDDAFADIQSLLNQLRRLKGYFRLQPDSGFDPLKQAKLQRTLLLRVISGLLDQLQVQAEPHTAELAREYIQVFINEHTGLNELDDLQKLLQEKNYFKENDFQSLYLKTLISFKKGDYNGIIDEIESLRQSLSFVRKEQASDYTHILLLLIDSYYSSKLLTAAEGVAQELLRDQPDNPDVLWRVLRVQKILGDEGAPDRQLNEKLKVVENSRFLTVVRPRSSFDVYLFNPPAIEIVFAPALLATFKPKQLAQVLVDGKIAFESYVDELPAKIMVGPPFVAIESKVKVQVIVL